MIIDFHTHVLSPEDQDKYTTSKFHQTVLASRDFGRRHPATIDNVLEAAKIGADICTCPPALIDQLFNHPLTTIGLEKFLKDWEKAQAVKA